MVMRTEEFIENRALALKRKDVPYNFAYSAMYLIASLTLIFSLMFLLFAS